MTPGQARTELLSFFFLLVGAAINALYMQDMQAGAAARSRAAVERPSMRPAVERGRRISQTRDATLKSGDRDQLPRAQSDLQWKEGDGRQL